jgi:hypothetical protein
VSERTQPYQATGPDAWQIPEDPRELGKQFVDLLDQIRAGCRLAIVDQATADQEIAGQDGLFLAIDHEGVMIAAVRNEREFARARLQRMIEVLAREISPAMPPEQQVMLAGRRAAEIMPRFQMIRP